MGIDIYATWPGQTDKEEQAQVTGFSGVHGHVGYLREAYHGGPYVTKYLLSEAFDAPEHEAAIPAHVLRERLPIAVLMHLYREQKLYGGGPDPSRIEIGQLGATLAAVFKKEIPEDTHTAFAASLSPESIAHAKTLIGSGILPDTAKSFVDFVELCEAKERARARSAVHDSGKRLTMTATARESRFIETRRVALIEATTCAIQEDADGTEWPCGTCACALLGKVMPTTAPEYSEHNDPVDRINEVWRAHPADARLPTKEIIMTPKSNCCGADLVDGIECSNCGAQAGDPALQDTIRRVVEAHDSLCLDVKEERETLIAALFNELSEQYSHLAND
jgi:hypothetical protein